MQLDWTTFLLEIVNFLILVWILKRFLYRPVLDVIARRRASIEGTLADAKKRETDAQELRSRYEKRLEDWEHEREAARGKLAEEMGAERKRRLAQIDEALQAEREKAGALEARRVQEERRGAEQRAMAQGARFAGRVLERLAGPELDARLVDVFVEDVGALAEEQRHSLVHAAAQPGARLRIVTARPLAEGERKRLSDAMKALLERSLEEDVSEAPELIAGLRIVVGPWVLAANLRDELAFFQGGANRAD